MAQTRLSEVAARIRDQAAAQCAASQVPGYLAGVYHDGQQEIVAYGVANATTGAPMLEATGFLYGSITKVMTATLILQQVERGIIDIDAPVVRYLREFRLAEPSTPDQIRVHHLLNHTNGIDADLFFPEAEGRDAVQAFVDGLERHCGALFAPGEYISYSNGGMIVAGRLLEVVTGTPYHALLAQGVYGPVGMDASCTSAADAILRSTAVGHFPDPAGAGPRRTAMFKLPDSWAPAGATPIGTIHDLLAFGRTHLRNGLSPAGRRVLSGESAARMRTVSYDMETPNVQAMGLGWPLMPFGGASVLSISGASPGGVAVLAVVPGHDLVFAAFANAPSALPLHNRVLLNLLREHLGLEPPDLGAEPIPVADLAPFAGTYRSNQLRVDVAVVDGHLEETVTYEPEDEAQARTFSGFCGGRVTAPPRRFAPVRAGLFAPAGMPLAALTGYMRALLVSYHGVQDGRAGYRCAAGRMTRRCP